MHRKTTGRSNRFMAFLKHWRMALTGMAAGLILLIGCLVINWTPVYAFFSDMVGGSTTVTTSELGIDITKVEVCDIKYGEGRENIYSKALLKNIPVNSSDAVTAIADGYILPFQITMKNTGKVEADLIPEFSVTYSIWNAGPNHLDRGDFYIYEVGEVNAAADFNSGDPSNILFDDNKIFADSGIQNQIESGTNEFSTVEKVAAGSSKTIRYKLYLKRSNFDRSYGFANLKIAASAKAVLPGKGSGASWYAEDSSKEFTIATSIFNLPKAEFVELSSDNYIEKNNTIKLKCATDSKFTYRNINPLSYHVYRDDKTDKRTENKVPFTDAYSDADISWSKTYTYKTESYDDYDNKIGTSWNYSQDFCDGGLVNIPDAVLRNWALGNRCNSKDGNKPLNTNIPVTKNNFTAGNLKADGTINPDYITLKAQNIKDLEGLQHVQVVSGLYLDNNNFSTIVGKLPPSNTWKTTEISLSNNNLSNDSAGNPKSSEAKKAELAELEKYTSSLRQLFLSNMGLDSSYGVNDLLGKFGETNKLTNLGITNNNLIKEDVTAISNIKTMKSLDISGNGNLAGVASIFDKDNLPNLTSLQLNGCAGGEGTGKVDYDYTKNHGSTKVSELTGDFPKPSNPSQYYVTTRFPAGCQILMNKEFFWGVDEKYVTSARNTAEIEIQSEDDQAVPIEPETTQPEGTDQPESSEETEIVITPEEESNTEKETESSADQSFQGSEEQQTESESFQPESAQRGIAGEFQNHSAGAARYFWYFPKVEKQNLSLTSFGMTAKPKER